MDGTNSLRLQEQLGLDASRMQVMKSFLFEVDEKEPEATIQQKDMFVPTPEKPPVTGWRLSRYC
jgi:hypothetical protein